MRLSTNWNIYIKVFTKCNVEVLYCCLFCHRKFGCLHLAEDWFWKIPHYPWCESLYIILYILYGAVCGWVNPNILNDVWVILKFAFPVTKQIIFFYIRFLHFLYNFCIWLIIAGVWSNGSKAGSLLKWHYLFRVFLFVVECSFSLWIT